MRVMGYCLTGITREHALFFGYGTGANGKGTFLNTMSAILGGYAAVAPMETFTASPTDRHPTDLAMLRGARLVAAQETEEGRRWAEGRIKAMTGGDPVTARFMRRDFFTFIPLFKLFIAGNHKPGLRGVDEAIRRRLNLIPFTVTIPVAERDVHLADKLGPEMPGILAWAIEGCLLWQRVGLQPPATVVEATHNYMAAEDALSLWIMERCKRIGYGGTEFVRAVRRLAQVGACVWRGTGIAEAVQSGAGGQGIRKGPESEARHVPGDCDRHTTIANGTPRRSVVMQGLQGCSPFTCI